MPIISDQYTICRHPEGGFIWTPPKGSPQLRDALDLKYPDIVGDRAKMQEALCEFLNREKSSMSPAQSLSTVYAASAHDSSSLHNTSDSSLGQTRKRGCRKGPLSEEGRKGFQKNYGKACEQHRKSRTKCDPNTCRNRLPDEFSSGDLSSVNQRSLLEPHRNANINTPRAHYSHMHSFGPETWGMNGMPLGVVQSVPTVNTNAAGTSGFNPPPPGDVPTWSRSPTVSSQYGSHPMENKMSPLTQTALSPVQSYGYPPSQMSYGDPKPFMVTYTNPDGAYNYIHPSNASGQTLWAYDYTPMAAQQALLSNPTRTTTPEDFGYYPTASTNLGYNDFEPSFQNNFDNNSRSVNGKTSKPSKASLRAKIRAIFKFASRISSSKHQVQIEGKPLVLIAS